MKHSPHKIHIALQVIAGTTESDKYSLAHDLSVTSWHVTEEQIKNKAIEIIEEALVDALGADNLLENNND